MLNIFNNGSGTYSLYEDDGESTDYTCGKGAFTRFELVGSGFTIHPAVGDTSYLPTLRTYTLRFRCGIREAEVLVNGEKETVQIQKDTIVLSGIKPTDLVQLYTK